MKVLLVANLEGGWPYIHELRDNLIKNDLDVDVFDTGNIEILKKNNEKLNFFHLKIWRFILKIPVVRSIFRRIINPLNRFLTIRAINKIHKWYDIIEIHYVAAWHYSLLKKIDNRKKVILFFWGSDFYVDKYYLDKDTHKYADFLVFAREGMAADFLRVCGNEYRDKIHYLNWGIGALDYIENIEKRLSKSEICEKIGIPDGSFVITCGHNARDLMQHEIIIENINKLKQLLPENYILVFPFTYRYVKTYHDHIKKILDKYGLRHKFILEFLSQEDVAGLRIITDIHINLVTSDALNASMVENLYAKSLVVNGSWLKYDELDKKNIFYVKAGKDDLYLVLQKILKDFSFYSGLAEKNRALVYNNFSWGNAIIKWIVLYKKISQVGLSN
jgi:glycosyltransferase involved in cell wall biosynthesis